MINKIDIRNFKLHDNTTINLSNLTILTGMNGMGKSSVIQSLLLLRQSDSASTHIDYLNLKGDLCDIGTAGGVACQSSKSDYLDIKISLTDNEPLDFQFKYTNDIYDTELAATTSPSPCIVKRGCCSIFNDNFQYIGAFRFGPQKSYNRDTNIVKTKRQISKSMGQCEYAVHFLDTYKHDDIEIKELKADNTANDDYKLLYQVELWMRKISPNIKVNVERIDESFKLNYKFIREGEMMTESISAINTGFGITYVLPIVVAILSAKKGALIIIENPEAHIHPKGQAVLMELIALAAKNGVQVIIETHSDHIINGALVAVVKGEISSEQLSIYYFDRDESSHTAIAHHLEVTDGGHIRRPPKGFFDQIDIDLKLLTGF